MGLETMAAVSVLVAAAGTGVSTYAAVDSGKKQDELFKYQAALEQEQARAVERQALVAAQQTRESNQAALSRIRAKQGQSGIVDQGSALENLSSFARNLEADALDIERQGRLEKDQLSAQSQISRIQGRNASRTGMLGAGTSLLGGTAEIGYNWQRMKGGS